MPTTVTVLYPKTSDSKFDLDYYLGTHMPLVAKEFGPYGFKGYRVIKFIGTPQPGVESPYSIQCSLEFDTPDQVTEALKATGAKVLGDVPNFSNKDAILLIGDVVG